MHNGRTESSFSTEIWALSFSFFLLCLSIPNPGALTCHSGKWLDILIQNHHKCWGGYSLSTQNRFNATQLVLLSLGLLSDYEFLWMVIWGVFLKQNKRTNKNYTGIRVLPLFLHVLHAQEYVQRPIGSLKIMSWSLLSIFQYLNASL